MTENPDLITSAKNTWCPGCGNFSLQHALKTVIGESIASGTPKENIVVVTGIGCHAKMADYLNVNSFYTLHGRTIPVASGIKLANPDLEVICCAGDGDMYAEGLDHLIFAAKRNIGLKVIIHNNRVYGLTTGQYTPTSPLGYQGKSTPHGTQEFPLNPIELMLASGAGFIARGYTRKQDQLRELFREALRHHGFAFLDILQICATFFNSTEYYQSRIYDLPESHNPEDFGHACAVAKEWDYNSDARIALGVIHRRSGLPSFEDRLGPWAKGREGLDEKVARFLAERS